MKNNKILLVLALCLAALAVFYIYKKSNTTLKQQDSSFAVADTANISKIFMADRSGRKITLDRKTSGQWLLNTNYTARQDLIKVLLETIATLEVKATVPKAARNTVIKDLAASAIKVEIYKGENLAKTYYVGGATPDSYGTFMLLDNAKDPYIMQVPENRGYLTPRYTTLSNEWRDRHLFKYNKGEIAQLKIDYLYQTDRSFVLNAQSNSINLSKSGKAIAMSQAQLQNYLSQYANISVEGYANPKDKDSIISRGPFILMSIVDTKGNNKEVKIFRMPNYKGATGEDGKELPYDIDNMYALINKDQDFVTIQHYVFDKLLIDPSTLQK